MNIEKYFRLAKNVSELSDYSKKNIHIGAVLVYKNKVISVGYNTDKTSPIQKKYNKYRITDDRVYNNEKQSSCIHAEMKTLIDTRDMDINWNKANMFIYRESNGYMRNCYPCQACMRAIKDRGIKNIFYTNENGYNYERIEVE